MKHCASPEVVRLPEALIYVQQQRVSVRHCTHNLGPLFEPAASIIYSTHTSQAVERTGQPCSKSAHHSALLSAHTALRVSRDGCCRVCANTGYCSSLLLSLCVGRKAKMATLSQCKTATSHRHTKCAATPHNGTLTAGRACSVHTSLPQYQ